MITKLLDAFLPASRSGTVQTLGHPAAGVVGWLGTGAENSSGVAVAPDVALTYAAVWCATRILSETLATLPCVLYRRVTEGDRQRATDDPRYFLMHDEPHPALSPVSFYETITAHAVLSGNGYARIVRSQLGDAAKWIAQQQESFAAGNGITFAIVLAEEEQLIGSIGMEIAREHQLARLSYWLGTDYWNHGYCTEAVRAMLGYGFTRLSLHRIYAPHFHNNPASGRVLRKVGMTYEGRMREHYIRFGQFVDVEIYGMLREEFLNDSAH